MHKSTGAINFSSKVKEKLIKGLLFKCSPQEAASAGRLGRWSHCGSRFSVPSHHSGSLGSVSSRSHRWRQQQVWQVTTCYFARLLGAQLHNGCVGSQGRAGGTFLPCELLGRCYLPQWVSERWRYFQAVRSACWFLARSGEFSMQSVSLLVAGSSPNPQAHQGFLKENQNNLPKRVKTWRKISLIQWCSVMGEAQLCLPAGFSPRSTFTTVTWPNVHWSHRGDFPVISMDVWLCSLALSNALNSLQIFCGHQGIHKCLSFYCPE